MKKAKINTKKIRKAVGTGVSFVFGSGHFVLKSTADLCASTEAVLCSKITGQQKDKIYAERHQTTAEAQEQAKEIKNEIVDILKNLKPKYRSSDPIATDLINDPIF